MGEAEFMRADVYVAMAQAEDTHWWFRGRRTICKHILDTLTLPNKAAILDVGSGTGGNLAMLKNYGTLYAMEMDKNARALASARNIVTVEAGVLPHNIPFSPQQFDLAVMCDVLEHVEEDYDTLMALHHRLSEGGRLLLTVPAFQFLWSRHDTLHHHKRRYHLPALISLVEKAGFKVSLASYINFWLFPLIAIVRLVDRCLASKKTLTKEADNAELILPPTPINRLLENIFSSEAYFISKMRLPFGVSIILLAQKV